MLVEGVGDDEEEPQEELEEELELAVKTLQLSLNSYKGLTTHKSFKVWGQIREQPLRVLVDCGSTSNFLSWEMAKLLQLTIDATPRYSMEVGNG